MENIDVITKQTSFRESRIIFEDYHGFGLKDGWELGLSMLLQDCDRIEVHGYGSKCFLTIITDD